MLMLPNILAIRTESNLLVAPALVLNLCKLSQQRLRVEVGVALRGLRRDALLVVVLRHLPLG
jgi:hypothetical protein